MSKTVDTRVVEMKFDNKNFEANVSQSMSTLDKLKKALKLDGVADGFDKIDKASSKVNLNPLSNACEKVGQSFSGLEVVAISALATITSQAVMAGERMVKALSIDQVTAGFNEYELKMGSVQTIMAATGADLSTVKGYLEELNEYADRTIYSFSDMTTNIGKFTNAGVALDDAVLAMKGISNEAAVSGANAAEASRAMYNLAQSLSMGYVQYIDWKSIENANMATVEFKKNIADTAVKLGVVAKAGEDAYTIGDKTYNLQQLFKDALKDQWLTTDVLIGTLRDYADETTDIGKKAYAAAQDVKTWTQLVDTTKEAIGSGWATTFELIIGDFEEAKELFTKISQALDKIVGKIADARNAFIGNALTSNYNKLITTLEKTGVTASDLQTKLKEIGSGKGVDYATIISEAGSFSKAMRQGKIDTDDLKDAISSLASGGTKEVTNATTAIGLSLEELNDIAWKVIRGDYGNGEDRVKALTEAGYEYSVVQEAVNRLWVDASADISDLVQQQTVATTTTEENTEAMQNLKAELGDSDSELNVIINHMSELSGREMIIESFAIHFTNLGKIIASIGEAFRSVFKFDSSDLKALIGQFYIFSNRVKITDDTLDKIRRTFAGLFAAIHIVTSTMSIFIKLGLKLLNSVLNKLGYEVLDLTAGLGDLIVKLDRWLNENTIVQKGIDKLSDAIVFLIKKIRELYETAKSSEKVINTIEFVKTTFNKFVTFMTNALKGAPDWFKGLFESFSLFKKHTDEIGVSTANAGQIFKAFNDDVTAYVTGTVTGTDDIAASINKSNGIIGTLLTTLKNVYAWFMDYVVIARTFIDEHVNIVNLIAAIIGLGVIRFLITLGRVLKTLTGPFTAVIDILNAAKGVFGNLSKSLKRLGELLHLMKFVTVAAGVLLLSTSIFVLAMSMVSISKIPTNKISAVSLSIIGLALAVSAMAAALAVLNKYSAQRLDATNPFNNIATQFLEIAVSVGIIALALDTVAKTANNPNMKTGMRQLILLAGDVFVATFLLNYQSKMYGKFTDTTKTFKRIATSLLAISISLAILSLVPTDKLWGAVGGVTVILTVVMALSIVMGKLQVELAPLASAILASAISMILVAGSVWILKKTFESLYNFLNETLTHAQNIEATGALLTASIVGIVAAMAGLVKALQKINSSGITDITIKMGGTMAGIGIGILSLTLAIELMKDLLKTKPEKTLLATGVIFGLTAGLIFMMSKFPMIRGKDQKTLFGTLAGLGICMLLISGSFALATIAAKYSNPAICIGIGAGLAALIAVIGFAVKNASGIDKGAATFIALAACIVAITVCVLLLSSLKNGDIEQALYSGVAVAAVIAGVTVLLKAVSKIGNTPVNNIGILLSLAVVIGLIGGVLTLLANTINNTGNSMLAAVGALSVVFIGLYGLLNTISGMQTPTLNSIIVIGVLGAVISGIASAMALLATQNWSSILVAAAGMSAVMFMMTKVMASVALMGAPTVVAAVTIGVLGAAISMIAASFSLLAQNDWGSILSATLGMAAVIFAMSIVIESISAMGALAMTSIVSVVAIGAVISLMALAFGQLAQNDWGSILATTLGMAAVIVAMAGALAILAPISGPAMAAGLAMMELGVALLIIAGAAMLFATALDTILNALLNFIAGIKEIFDINSPSEVMRQIGDYIMEGFINGIVGKIEDVVNWFKNLGKNIIDTVKGFFDGVKEKGKQLMEHIGSGIQSAKDKVSEKVTDVMNKAKDVASGFKEKFKTLGGNVMDGLKNGITGAAENVKNAVAGVANSAVDKFKSLLGIHSPSKVFDSLGQFVGQGLTNGINKLKSSVSGAVGNLTKPITDNVQSVMDDVNNSLANSFDASGLQSQMEQQMADVQSSMDFGYSQPTITPVFDASNVYAGLDDINTQFAGQSYDLAASANFNYDKTLFDKFEANQNGLNIDNSDVVSAINSLNGRMDNMTQAITNMQIVMDTGTLVGSIAEPMDNALGQRMVFAGRGI